MSASIRKTKTASGATAVQVVRYERRRVVVLKHLGSAHNEDELAAMVDGARLWIARSSAQHALFEAQPRRTVALATTQYMGATHALAYEVLHKAAQRCGLDALGDELLLDLAIMRLVEPGSKLRAIEHLKEFFGRHHAERTVYRALRRMVEHKDPLERIAVGYARDRLRASLNMVLYDVTTLYFESFRSDELRTPGFSKDGKPQQPQIVLGLLVTTEGVSLGLRGLHRQHPPYGGARPCYRWCAPSWRATKCRTWPWWPTRPCYRRNSWTCCAKRASTTS